MKIYRHTYGLGATVSPVSICDDACEYEWQELTIRIVLVAWLLVFNVRITPKTKCRP